MFTSPDGVTWNSRDSGVINLWGIAWSGNTLVAVGLGRSAISTDGITWTPRSTSSYLRDIAWGATQFEAQFVAVGDSGIILTSP